MWIQGEILNLHLLPRNSKEIKCDQERAENIEGKSNEPLLSMPNTDISKKGVNNVIAVRKETRDGVN